MTKLPRNLKPKRLVKILTKLGFEKVGAKGSHIRFKHADGRWTHVSVHPKPIPPRNFEKDLNSNRDYPRNTKKILCRKRTIRSCQ